jgi:hypothetical protein
MSDVTQEVDRRFRIVMFQLTVSRAHAAHGAHLTSGALRWMSPLLEPRIAKSGLPTMLEATGTNVVVGSLRDDANTHLAVRVDRTGKNSAAANIDVVSVCWRSSGEIAIE